MKKIMIYIRAFIVTKWHWIIFFVLSFMALSFLIFQDGMWEFTDSGFFYSDIEQTKKVLFSKFSQISNTDGFYFGFDNSQRNFSQVFTMLYQFILTVLLGTEIGQIVYYFIYYLTCFYFGMKFFKKMFVHSSDFAIKIGALFFAFNPFSLLISTLFSTSYVYALTPVFLLNLFKYLECGKKVNLLFAILSGVYCLSYPRLVPIIFLLFIFVIWIFNKKELLNFKRLVFFGAIFVLVMAPFLFNSILSVVDTSNGNIVQNYQEGYSRYQIANYNFKQSFINSFSYLGGFTPSVLSFYYNPDGIVGFTDNFATEDSVGIHRISQICFNIGVLIIFLITQRNLIIKSKEGQKIVMLIILIFFINTMGYFTNLELFLKIHTSILVFLYNDYGFMQFVQIFLYTFLIIILLDRQIRNTKSIGTVLIMFFLLVNILPLLMSHYGLRKINNTPESYKSIAFYNEKYIPQEAALFAPYHWLKFEWAPYYVHLDSFPFLKYQSLVTPNLRVIGRGFANFYNNLYNNFSKENLSNLLVFNLKSIFVFHDIENANSNIDAYKVFDIEQKSKKHNQELLKNKNVSKGIDNNNYTQYKFKDSDSYDFLVYAPNKVVGVTYDGFYDLEFDLTQRPVIIDKSKTNKLSLIDEERFVGIEKDIYIKTPLYNPNKYYIKISQIKDGYALLQLNQIFSESWKMYFVDKSLWEDAVCQNDWEHFSGTRNKKCLYRDNLLNYEDLVLLKKSFLKKENHFRGNFIGNTFLITSDDIPNQYKQDDELYVVVYFGKQFHYIITMTISGVVIIVLLALAIIEVVKIKK